MKLFSSMTNSGRSNVSSLMRKLSYENTEFTDRPSVGDRLSVYLNIVGDFFRNTSYYRKFYPDTDEIPREIDYSSHTPTSTDLNNLSNLQRNNKYTILNFIPKFLYEQLTIFSNFYFLFIAFTQFFPSLKVGFLFSYLAPVVVVLVFALVNELKDELQKIYKDREANNTKYVKYTNEKTSATSNVKRCLVKYSDIKVGDIIHLKKGQTIPADCLLLSVSTDSDIGGYIKTDGLDGETDWKYRCPPSLVYRIEEDKNEEDYLNRFFDKNIKLEYETPSKEIYSFNGTITVDGSKENLSLDNTIWASTALVSCSGLALVLYVGKDTRVKRNTKPSVTKFGKTEKEISQLTKILLGVMVSCAVSLLGTSTDQFMKRLLKYVVLFSHMIPMSLRLGLDVGKLFFSWLVKRDEDIKGTIVRTSNIPEELGRVSYLFSDKTGTLTENVMAFRKVILKPHLAYSEKALLSMRSELTEIFKTDSENWFEDFMDKLEKDGSDHNRLKLTMLAISMCHNVFIKGETGGKDKYGNVNFDYISSSPDEIALIKATNSFGINFVQRNSRNITISIFNKHFEFEILYILPFSSEKKRMGILLRPIFNNKKGKPFMIVKGAETAMGKILKTNEWFLEEVDKLARDGFRTLVYGIKFMSEKDLAIFNQNTDKVESERNEELYKSTENELELCCITGIEDRLQENVQSVLETVRAAGIKAWILTGDKIETAICVARSARLISFSQSITTITSSLFKYLNSENCLAEISKLLDKISMRPSVPVIIEGEALETILKSCPIKFAKVLSTIEVVVCCRCTPEQKAEVTRLIGKVTNKVTLAIGDGGNDISMIREASVGLGIFGLEGKQASMAADYAIPKFSYLQKLLLWHGRNSYVNLSNLSISFVQRGLLLSFVQYFYSFIFYKISASIFPDVLMFNYTTFYSSFAYLPIYFDRDIRYRVIILYPELYREMQKGRLISVTSILTMFIESLYQSTTILIWSCILFKGNKTRFSLIAYATALFTCYSNVMFLCKKKSKLLISGVIASIIIFFLSPIILPNAKYMMFIYSFSFLFKTIITSSMAIIPVYLISKVYKKFYPPLSSKFKFT